MEPRYITFKVKKDSILDLKLESVNIAKVIPHVYARNCVKVWSKNLKNIKYYGTGINEQPLIRRKVEEMGFDDRHSNRDE